MISKSKIVGGCVLALCIGSAMGQTSHVTTAYSLYKACFQGTAKAQGIYSTDTLQAEEIVDLVNGIDQNCLAWTYAWFPSFANNKDVTEMRPDETARFDKLRFGLIDMLLDDLSDLLPANKKNPIKGK